VTAGPWLSKSEVNELYYRTVGGEILFETEASVGYHPSGAARLIAAHAASQGRRQARILEIGANNCSFARAVLYELRRLEPLLERIDYLAVDLSRTALEAAAAWEEAQGVNRRVLWPGGVRSAGAGGRPEKPEMVALVTVEGEQTVNLGFVHADANQFAQANTQRFDVAILNELLDDMPCRAFFADQGGRRFEIVPQARAEGERWTVRIEAEPTADARLATLQPRTVTARSAEWTTLVTGTAGALAPGGMLLLHDYGFADGFVPLDDYDRPPPSMPPFASVEYPPGVEDGFPRSFFRVFGNEAKRVVQVTNDVSFAELGAALEGSGSVLVLPHGNQIVNSGGTLERGQGVFLSEFCALGPGEDLPAILQALRARQEAVRADYQRDWMGGRATVFLDLVYLRS
jgi:hypothetical protein